MHVYLLESALKVGLHEGRLVAKATTTGETLREVPFGDVDGISVYGMAHLSTQLLRGCLRQAVSVSFYTEDGYYLGSLSSPGLANSQRQRLQVLASDRFDFCLAWSKRIVAAKIGNSLAHLLLHAEDYTFSEDELRPLRHSLETLDTASTIDEVLGFEGNAARGYFSCLGRLVEEEAFAFRGRSARPPKDAFNAMLSYGYSRVHRNIVGAIESAGLSPYFGFMHTLHPGHEALASDLIEEWRAVIVDRTVLQLVNDGEVEIGGFTEREGGGIQMDRKTMQTVTRALSDALMSREAYFLGEEDGRKCGFQVAIRKKVGEVVDAIESGDPERYVPYAWSVEQE